MLIYTTFIFFIFGITFILSHPKTDSANYLLGGIVGWLIFITALLVYISRFNFSYWFIKDYFQIPYGLWRYILYINVDLRWILRLINFGSALFVACLYLYTLSATPVYRISQKINIWVYVPCLILLFQLVIYDPDVFRYFYKLVKYSKRLNIGYDGFFRIYEVVEKITAIINCGILIISWMFLCYTFFIRRKLPVVRNYFAVICITVTYLVAMYTTNLSWAPTSLISFKEISTYPIFNPPPYMPFSNANTVSILVSAIAFFVITFMTYKFRSTSIIMTSTHKSKNKSLYKDNLGLRSFAHSFKNQIIAIQFESENLLECINKEENKELYESALAIHQMALKSKDSLTKMHEQLKTQTILFEPLCINDFVRDFAKYYTKIVPSHIEFTYDISQKNANCFIDEEHMNESLVIIMRNAIEAIGKMDNGLISLLLINSDSRIFIDIIDNGEGIDSSNLPHIFNTFYTTKQGDDNWGIGLTYAKEIISLHKGEIIVNSIPNKGTSVRISLPKIR